MYENKDATGGFSFSWPFITAVCVAFVGITVTKPKLDSARPTEIPGEALQPENSSDNRISTRLWQDPLQGLLTQGTRKDSRNDLTKVDIQKLWDDLPRDSVAQSRKAVLIVLSIVPENLDSDSMEARRRTRYALLSAMGRDGYVPVNSTSVQWVNDPVNPRRRLPYEWIKAVPQPGANGIAPGQPAAVCLLWLAGVQATDMHGKTQKNLEYVNTIVASLLQAKNTSPHEVVLMGNIGSDALIELANSAKLLGTTGVENHLSGARLLAQHATAAITRHQGEKYDLEKKLRDQGIGLEFLIGTDKDLAKQLIEELQLRGVKAGRRDNDIAIISEWDTIYGRNMLATFAEALSEAVPLSEPIRNVQVVSGASPESNGRYHIDGFTYLRGLDGKLPNRSEGSQKTDTSKGARKPDDALPTADEAEGDRQVDYLRRLTERMRNKGSYRAIGVLGSDAYDKLLILKAIRPSFPDAVFFTTDLDARLLQLADIPQTRNLIIASHFGLSLKDALQGQSPPFRSSYDTATYLAGLHAIKSSLLTNTPNPDTKEVLVFEVGRNGAFQLSVPGNDSLDNPGPRSTNWLITNNRWLSILLAGLLGFLLVACISPSIRHRCQSIACLNWGWFDWITVLSLLLLAILVILVYWEHGRRNGHPFSMSDGISVWPSEFIRFGVGVFCIAAMVAMAHSMRYRNQAISDRFEAADFLGTRSEKNGWRSFGNALLSVSSIWKLPFSAMSFKQIEEAFAELSSFARRFARCFWMTVANLACLILLIRLFDSPVVPTRGDIAWWTDQIITWGAFVALVSLISLVVDCTQLCYRLVKSLTENEKLGRVKLAELIKMREKSAARQCSIKEERQVGGPSQPEESDERSGLFWPKGILSKGLKDLAIDLPKNDLSQAVLIESAVSSSLLMRMLDRLTDNVAKMIYYPFFALFLLILAQSRFFANWSWSPPIVLFFALCATTTVVCATLLQRIARRTKRQVLCDLDEMILMTTGGSCEKLKSKLEGIRVGVERIDSAAFSGFYDNPIVRAVSLPLTGAGGLAAVESLLFAL